MTLYERVLMVARPFLAGQTELFMQRQCHLHLGIPAESISIEHLPKLSWWARVSASIVLSKEDAEALSQKILALAALP